MAEAVARFSTAMKEATAALEAFLAVCQEHERRYGRCRKCGYVICGHARPASEPTP